jgi:hypothetical protein
MRWMFLNGKLRGVEVYIVISTFTVSHNNIILALSPPKPTLALTRTHTTISLPEVSSATANTTLSAVIALPVW